MQYYGLLDKTVERGHSKKGSPGKTFEETIKQGPARAQNWKISVFFIVLQK